MDDELPDRPEPRAADLWARPEASEPEPSDLWGPGFETTQPDSHVPPPPPHGSRTSRSPGIDRLRDAVGRLERATRDVGAYVGDLVDDLPDSHRMFRDALLDLADVLEGDVAEHLSGVRRALRRGRTGRVLPGLRAAAGAAREALLYADDLVDDAARVVPLDGQEADRAFGEALAEVRTAVSDELVLPLRRVRRALEASRR